MSSDCEACQYYFGTENISEYDCTGQCGLCDLCDYNPVKECEIFCKKGVHACIENCTLGQAICLSCQQSQTYHYQDQVKYSTYNNAYEIHTKDPDCSCTCNCKCDFWIKTTFLTYDITDLAKLPIEPFELPGVL